MELFPKTRAQQSYWQSSVCLIRRSWLPHITISLSWKNVEHSCFYQLEDCFNIYDFMPMISDSTMVSPLHISHKFLTPCYLRIYWWNYELRSNPPKSDKSIFGGKGHMDFTFRDRYRCKATDSSKTLCFRYKLLSEHFEQMPTNLNFEQNLINSENSSRSMI